MGGPNILNKLERKIGRFAIPNLMLYIVIGTGIVFAFDWIFPELGLTFYFYFDKNLIMHGQVWRILSFVLMPESSNPLFMLISMYFYWLCGSRLESQWGSFRFNVFYLVGVIGTIIGGMITGVATNSFLNMSLFLAFALLYPNLQFMLFFVIPIKAKYMAYIMGAYLLFQIIIVPLGYKLCVIIAFLNIALFFGGDFYKFVRDKFKYRKVRKNFKIHMSHRDEHEDD